MLHGDKDRNYYMYLNGKNEKKRNFNTKFSNKFSHCNIEYRNVFFSNMILASDVFCLTSDEIFPLLNGCTCEQSVACKCSKYVTMKQNEIQYISHNACSLLFNNEKGQ